MVTSSYAPVKQAGNGVTLAFNFGFKILAASDLVVSKIDASGNSSGTLILGTDYTVTFDPIAENGTVTYTVAPVASGFSNIARSSDVEQQTSLPREGPAPAKTVETMVDKLTLLMQEVIASVNALSVTTVAGLAYQTGTFAVLDAAAGTTPFIARVTDSRTIQVYLGDRTAGTNGWLVLGGY